MIGSGRQSGLGRGLGALIPQRSESQAPSSDFQSPNSDFKSPISNLQSQPLGGREIPVGQIDPNPHQPRKHFDHGDLEDLVASVKEHGILQPIVVTQKPDGRYELIMGERRLRAAKIAGLDQVPALVRTATEQQKMELAIIENVQRADLNPIEEARAYLRLQEEIGLTQDEVGERVGKSRPQVANTIRLLQLPEPIQHALVEKRISASNARTLLSLPSDTERLDLFKRMLEGNFTVRQTEARVPHARSRSGYQDPNVADIENRLRSALGTKVTVKKDSHGEGEMKIKFFNDEDLQGIVRKITSLTSE
jgi:ParB family chromosome partitioning protein